MPTGTPRFETPPGAAEAEGGSFPIAAVGRALIRRPDLWSTSIRAGLSLAPRRWWLRPPFLPRPDARWLRFRMSTAYGGDGRFGPESAFDAGDLITWLEWRKSFPG